MDDVFATVSQQTYDGSATNQQQINGPQTVSNLSSLSVGAGSVAMYADKSGLRLGGTTVGAAPFSVDMSGNVIAQHLSLGSGELDLGGTVNGKLKIFNNSNTQIVQMDNGGISIGGNLVGIVFYNSIGGTSYGALDANISNSRFEIGSLNGKDMQVYGDHNITLTSANDINLNPTNFVHMYGRKVYFSASGSDYEFGLSGGTPTILVDGNLKTAIVPTSQGYRALYTNESPEVWFMDFCKDINHIDPLFEEVTEPPYHFIQCADGEYQIWGKRKGFADVRFEKKTETEFIENNKFWDTPRVKAKR